MTECEQDLRTGRLPAPPSECSTNPFNTYRPPGQVRAKNPACGKMLSRELLLAGDAIFSIDTPDKGHRTYRIRFVPASDRWPNAYFVDLLTGPDNTNDYSPLGKLDDFTGHVKTTSRSRHLEGSYVLTLLNRVLARIWTADHEAYTKHGYAVHHEGRCLRCGRTLTVPDSIASGVGPECHATLVAAGQLDW